MLESISSVVFYWDSGAYVRLGENGGSLKDLIELVFQYGNPSRSELV